MSKEAASKFVQTILNDAELRIKTAEIKPEEIVPFAKEMGYDFTLEELKGVKEEDIELSPDELESVAGGARYERDIGTYQVKVMNQLYVNSHYCWVKGFGRTVIYGPLHNWETVGHKEELILGGCLSWLGSWTNGYDILKCSRCGADGIRDT